MCEETGPPPLTVVEKATRRYEAARAARDGMQVDLAVLAGRALSSLHSQEENGRVAITLNSVLREESKTAEVLPSSVRAWLIPGTRYYLPDWQQGSYDRDFFSLSLEQTLVEQSTYGVKAITFNGFVERCNFPDYVGVCRGLDDLGTVIQAATKKRSDGMDND